MVRSMRLLDDADNNAGATAGNPAYFQLLGSTELFRGIDAAGLGAMLGCLGAKNVPVIKGGTILFAGDAPKNVGIVLEGMLHVTRVDHDGNQALVAVLSPGDMFAEALCCAGVAESPVTVMADADSTVVLLSFERILHICPNSCVFHSDLIRNMLRLIAGKNLMFQNHMEILGLKTIRAKFLRYIESFGARQGREVTIPLNREELANYLCVDRSALSHELMKMKREGLIGYKKNVFLLKH